MRTGKNYEFSSNESGEYFMPSECMLEKMRDKADQLEKRLAEIWEKVEIDRKFGEKS